MISKSDVMAGVKRFQTRFLNRIDEIIVFHKLTEKEEGKIFSLLINKSSRRMKKQGITIRLMKSKRFNNQKELFSLWSKTIKRAIQTWLKIMLYMQIHYLMEK